MHPQKFTMTLLEDQQLRAKMRDQTITSLTGRQNGRLNSWHRVRTLHSLQ